MPAPSNMLLLVNGQAGGSDADTVDLVAATLRRSGNVEVASTEDASDIDTAIDRLGRRTLVILGGDGSLHATVQRLWQRGELADADVGLVPLGTGNDFARSVGVPLDPAAAASALAGWVRRPLDLLVDETGGVVVNVVHAGAGADAAAKAASLKGALGMGAYLLGAIAAGVGASGWREAVEVDGAPVDVPGGLVLMIAVCNGRTIGGGTEICAPADPADGRLDVVVVTATDPAARLGFGAALRAGTHLERDDVQHLRGTEVSVVGEPIGYNADGEVSEPAPARAFRVVPGGWQLRLPG